MNAPVLITAKGALQEWYERILENDYELACDRVKTLLAQTVKDENGCMVTNTAGPLKLRFLGGQDRAYRFVYCILNRLPAGSDQVVRRRCHNRRCVNPEHLEIGTRADNLRDEWERRANSILWRLV